MPFLGVLTEWAIPDEELAKTPGFGKNKDADIAEAKKILSAAGHADTEFVILYYAPPASNEQTAVVLQQQMQKAGLNVRLDKKEYAAWVPLTLNLDYQMTSTGAGFRDNPDEYVYAPFHSKSSRNSTGYSDPEMDKILELQRSQLKDEERKKTVLEIQKKLIADAPYSFQYVSPVFEVSAAKLKGYKATYSSNRPRQFVRAYFDA